MEKPRAHSNVENSFEAVLKQCYQSASSNKRKEKKRNRGAGRVLRATRPAPNVNLSRKSFFGSFFVENLFRRVDNRSARAVRAGLGRMPGDKAKTLALVGRCGCKTVYRLSFARTEDCR